MADNVYAEAPGSFWDKYIKGRPQTPQSFWNRIFDYHATDSGHF